MPYKITGQANGLSVNFSVVWNNGIVNCNSKTVWTGTLQGRTLTTRWTLYRQGLPPLYAREQQTPQGLAPLLYELEPVARAGHAMRPGLVEIGD